MWYPQKRQWWVIWISIIAAFLVFAEPGPTASLFCLTIGALIVWQMQKPKADKLRLRQTGQLTAVLLRTTKVDAEEEEETPISEGHLKTLAGKYCGECGAPIEPTWKVCPHCGTKSWMADDAGR